MTIDFLPPVSVQTIAVVVGALFLAAMALRAAFGPPTSVARRWGLFALRAVVLLLLMALVANPVRVTETQGSVSRPEVYYVLDSSQSMAMGNSATRWQDALNLITGADRIAPDAPARIGMFRFGDRLSAIDADKAAVKSQAAGAAGPTAAPEHTGEADKRLAASLQPTDSDSRLVPALRQLSSRFGRRPPNSIVLFSDGRFRDADQLDEIAAHYKKQNVPIHVAPVGEMARGGDISIVALVAPQRVRKYSTAEVQVFLRSFGYEGRRSEVRLEAVGDDGNAAGTLASLPLTLRGGVQAVSLSFRTELEAGKLRVAIPAEGDEISSSNNAFPVEIAVDRTKIRVLYVEGSREPMRMVRKGDAYVVRGPHSDLEEALKADPDIECVPIITGGTTRRQRLTAQGLDAVRGFPDTVAELAAFDAIILSNIQYDAFTAQELEWIEQWVGRRGAGLCMVGGENGFAQGGWDNTLIEQILPVEMKPAEAGWSGAPVAVEPQVGDALHPLWHIMSDDRQNRDIVRTFPEFAGINSGLTVKENVAVSLASARAVGTTGETSPALVVGQYGKGRTMAMATATTAPWANEFVVNWGRGDNRYYAKFWRNAVYWLTENSSIGRRRLVIGADKRYYRPGEQISLQAVAYDEGAARTTGYRVVAMIEPQSALADLDSFNSPVLWPNGIQRTSGEEGPCIVWGEEFDLPKRKDQGDYQLPLDIAAELPAGSEAQALRVEVTAYEDYTQVDSTSVDIQILHDPFETQNPFPNHESMERVAKASGGRVLKTSEELAEVINDMEVVVGPPVLRKEPLWSRWPVLALLLGVLTVEWLWRRSLGLA